MNDYIERGLLDMRLMSAPIDLRKYDFVSVSVKKIVVRWYAKIHRWQGNTL